MAVATKTRRVLSDEDVATLLGLLKDSDSVELKLTVPEPQHRSTVDSLRLDPLNAQIRQIYFFDTPDLALDKQHDRLLSSGIYESATLHQRRGHPRPRWICPAISQRPH